MFTGITQAVGIVTSIAITKDLATFAIRSRLVLSSTKIGDSIAVNGVCLTATKITSEGFSCNAVPETLRRTNLGNLNKGSRVNLEMSLQANSRLGGHFVQGHVDTVAKVIALESDGAEALIATVQLPDSKLARYIANKGFITIDGMSITVIKINDDKFSVTFIPHTIQNSIVQDYQPGTMVNIEVDILAKYLERLVTCKTI